MLGNAGEDTVVPEGFVALADAVPGVVLEARYAGANNFTGAPVPGYEHGVLLLSRPAATALAAVAESLAPVGLGLKILDAYRPQRAVDHFLHWTTLPDDPVSKARYYPRLEKSELFARGYLVRQSSHSRGSTVDLTLVDLPGGEQLDMGGIFDFFDPCSRPDCPHASAAQRANRWLLRTVMERHGFEPLAEEWWHFTLRDEPWPDTIFDFVPR